MADLSGKRRFLRRPVQVEFCIHDESANSGELLFDTVDLSAGGAFIRSDLLFEVNEIMHVSFRLPTSEQLFKVKGRIVWVTRQTSLKGDPGMGIEFVDLDAQARDAIATFVNGDY